MNAEVNAVPGPETAAVAAVGNPATRPFYWAVRRELWEHRSLYIAPLVPAGLVLLFMLLGSLNLTQGIHFSHAPLSPDQQLQAITGIFVALATLVAIVASATAFFYCLDSLYGERRDRSILFWKSLPVSDVTTVLSKLFIPAVIVPVIVFVIAVATQLIVLLVGTVVLLAHGISAATIWSPLNLLSMMAALLYALLVSVLWLAPIYTWLLLVSSWARRSTFLWAVLPPLAVSLAEKLAFDTSYFAQMLSNRLGGVAQALVMRDHGGQMRAFGFNPDIPSHISSAFDPGSFFSSFGLWVGLAVAAGFVAAAVWMRRYREPL